MEIFYSLSRRYTYYKVISFELFSAVKESSEWPSLGLYSGIVDHLGNWAECMRASGPDGIRGQYCLAEMTIKNFPTNHYDSAGHLSTVGCDCEECSAWSMLWKVIELKFYLHFLISFRAVTRI